MKKKNEMELFQELSDNEKSMVFGGDTVNIYHNKLPDINKPVQIVKNIAHEVSDFFRGIIREFNS
ncbi:MAG: hypothetical protein J0L83_06455 [Chitinophagales bacterium]|nr:hypothetical protein [Chitinophagales bacterium]